MGLASRAEIIGCETKAQQLLPGLSEWEAATPTWPTNCLAGLGFNSRYLTQQGPALCPNEHHYPEPGWKIRRCSTQPLPGRFLGRRESLPWFCPALKFSQDALRRFAPPNDHPKGRIHGEGFCSMSLDISRHQILRSGSTLRCPDTVPVSKP
ncbi:hypothetical protein N656DRAFT_151752 [Canariomyces notabilis]|uniref:Uncharacterized protein n=1 Tax=Canariomyces notabilis TaxID=2074819 RepID=A0AAN6YRE1_9PEZI|nr:hypothetical protein N656DRAFT_151752 [Canariomyces arenarius]